MKLAILMRTDLDGQYVAHCPSLPGCIAKGDSMESARRRMQDAVVCYLAALDVPLPPRIVTEVQEMSRLQEGRHSLVHCDPSERPAWRCTHRSERPEEVHHDY